MGRAVILALAAGILIKLFVFDLMITDGRSMSPTIQSGKIIIINRLQYGLRIPGQKHYLIRWSHPKPGEVVVFYAPGGESVIKRCDNITGNDSFIALGDNSLRSYDSRSYGPIPAENTIGKVLGVR
ncbi:MAG: signal peptidase I [Treponema sp.]|nr:signal peptidase I [Treponema sp.]